MSMTMAMRTASVDGVDLHWSMCGDGPKTVILLHGWTCDETTWHAQVPALADAYRVATLDLPGHGRSASPAGGVFSIDLFAHATEAVRRETGARRVVLVGHSMGSAVALRYARLYPDRVAALVFVEGVITKRRTPAFALDRLSGPDGKRELEAVIRTTLFSRITTTETQDRILSMMLATPVATAIGVIDAMLRPDAWSDEIVPLPLLGVYRHGSWVAERKTLNRRFPALEYVDVPDAGHFLMMEKPDEFNRLLLDFLGRQTF